MSILKFNKNSQFVNLPKEGDFAFCKISELKTDVNFTLLGFILNTKGNYGDQYIAYIGTEEGNYAFSVPEHKFETIKELLEDEESVEEINTGKAGVVTYTYKYKDAKKEEKTGYSFNFVLLE